VAAEADVFDVGDYMQNRCSENGDERRAQRRPQREWNREGQSEPHLEGAGVVQEVNVEGQECCHSAEKAHRRQ